MQTKLGRGCVARTMMLIRPREAGEGDHAKRGGGALTLRFVAVAE